LSENDEKREKCQLTQISAMKKVGLDEKD